MTKFQARTLNHICLGVTLFEDFEFIEANNQNIKVWPFQCMKDLVQMHVSCSLLYCVTRYQQHSKVTNQRIRTSVFTLITPAVLASM